MRRLEVEVARGELRLEVLRLGSLLVAVGHVGAGESLAHGEERGDDRTAHGEDHADPLLRRQPLRRDEHVTLELLLLAGECRLLGVELEERLDDVLLPLDRAVLALHGGERLLEVAARLLDAFLALEEEARDLEDARVLGLELAEVLDDARHDREVVLTLHVAAELVAHVERRLHVALPEVGVEEAVEDLGVVLVEVERELVQRDRAVHVALGQVLRRERLALAPGELRALGLPQELDVALDEPDLDPLLGHDGADELRRLGGVALVERLLGEREAHLGLERADEVVLLERVDELEHVEARGPLVLRRGERLADRAAAVELLVDLAAETGRERHVLEHVLLDRGRHLGEPVLVDLVERAQLAAHALPVVDAPHGLEHERRRVERDALELLVRGEE